MAKRQIKRQIFRVDNNFRELLDEMKVFFGCTTHNAVFQHVLLFTVMDIAGLPENSSWTPDQKEAWEYCRQFAKEFHRTLLLSGAKRVLDKAEPDTKMSVDELMQKAEKEIENASIA